MEPKILNQFTARAGILKALAHPSRLFMVDQLNTGPMCVADLKGLVGSDTSTVSKHLSVLHNAGIVTREKRRNQVFLRPPDILCYGVLQLCRVRTRRASPAHSRSGEGFEMNWRQEWKKLGLIITVFLGIFFLPVGTPRFDNAVTEALQLVHWYAREHVLLCLIPAFFIAGAIAVFVSQAAVMKYLGVGAKKVLAYGVASVSGGILAVCSCTVLPLFAGIYRMGAGLGPATAFLYAGPAINVLAIVLTARILGLQLGIARAVGAVLFSVVIGLLMHFFFRREEAERAAIQSQMPEPSVGRPLWQTGVYFAAMVLLLIFATWGEPKHVAGFWAAVHAIKWPLAGASGFVLGIILSAWFELKIWKFALLLIVGAALAFLVPGALIPFAASTMLLSLILATSGGELREWFDASWGFAKQILPLLLLGVLVAGLLLGRPGQEGLIPSDWVARAVGGNSLSANVFAAVSGAFMYFATLTEVPILQGLLGAGMGQGPALALLLAGPALSLPSILVLRSIMGMKKTSVFLLLVVIMSTAAGLFYGSLVA